MNVQTYFDYSEHTEKMKQLQRRLFDLLLTKKYDEAIQVADDLIDEARCVRTWCVAEVEKLG